MKTLIAFTIASAALLFGGCSSAAPSGRADYANPAFDSRASKRAAREAEIRKIYPTLSEKQIEQKLASEFPAGVPR